MCAMLAGPRHAMRHAAELHACSCEVTGGLSPRPCMNVKQISEVPGILVSLQTHGRQSQMHDEKVHDRLCVILARRLRAGCEA